MDLLSSIFLVALLISLVVGIFIISYKCTNNIAKEIRGTPSVVASSSVHVNVYCDSHTKQIASARCGGGDARGEIQRQIQDLKLWHSTFNKVPSVSNGHGNKVVHDGSKEGCSGGQRQIQDLNLTNSKKVPEERRGNPSIVASSCVHVNVYGGTRSEPITIANSSRDQRQIQDLKLKNSTFKVPSVSTGDGSKVVHDGSTGGDSKGQRQIQDLNLTKSTIKAPSVSIGEHENKVVHDSSKDGAKDVTNIYSSNGSANKCGHQKGYFLGVSANGGGLGGVCAKDNGGDSDDGVGNGVVGGVDGRIHTNI